MEDFFLCPLPWQWQLACSQRAERCRQVYGPVCTVEMLRQQLHRGRQGPRVYADGRGQVEKVTGRFNSQFKTYTVGPFAGCVSQMTPSSVPHPRRTLFQRTSGWRGSQMWGIRKVEDLPFRYIIPSDIIYLIIKIQLLR